MCQISLVFIRPKIGCEYFAEFFTAFDDSPSSLIIKINILLFTTNSTSGLLIIYNPPLKSTMLMF